ncbi:MAG: hypothetical protein ABEI27_08770 [Halobellus sp.]|uniref:hypothetical protein n=1 Tax=Halobellus sp. TaxID=1979212 RepID=UPI0035D470CF
MIGELNGHGVTIALVEQNAEIALNLADRAYIIEKRSVEYTDDIEMRSQSQDLIEECLGVN